MCSNLKRKKLEPKIQNEWSKCERDWGPLKYNLFCSDQRKQKLSPVYKHLSIPTITEDYILLVILLINKFEREHNDEKEKISKKHWSVSVYFLEEENTVCKFCWQGHGKQNTYSICFSNKAENLYSKLLRPALL